MTCSWDGKILEWDLIQKEPVREVYSYPGKLVNLCIDKRGNILVGGSDGYSRLIDYKTGKEIKKITGFYGVAALSIDGKTAITLSKTGGILFWDLGKANKD